MTNDAPEIPVSDATHLFVGRTIEKMDASSCNQVEFRFTDGTVAVLHIECDQMGLSDVLVCSHCALVV